MSIRVLGRPTLVCSTKVCLSICLHFNRLTLVACNLGIKEANNEDGGSSITESELGREEGASCNQRVVCAIQELVLWPSPLKRMRKRGFLTLCTSCPKLKNVARPIRSLHLQSNRYNYIFAYYKHMRLFSLELMLHQH